ncbi:hypothetical protein [Roseomonas chloroacetimidivorans]|uniref:hypothetical protein n=1 Tax=Roseomonas chloroacetimidivorans TaxID=1766656 RepID=UPI003C76AC28
MSGNRWDGMPQNPERDGWHALNYLRADAHTIARWDARGFWNLVAEEEDFLPADLAGDHEYLGPVELPAQVAARVEEAVQKEREECAKLADQFGTEAKENMAEERREMGRLWDMNSYAAGSFGGEIGAAQEIADAIRARGTRPSQAEGEGRG